MGTGLSLTISLRRCQSLAATTAPTITAMGIHIVHSIGDYQRMNHVQEALASAHGGAGFSMGRFLQPLHAAHLRHTRW